MRETSSKVTLSGVPETMLQTVYARAKETQTRGAVRDEKAVEIIRRLDYDFSLADKDSAMSNGVIARTIVLDKLVKTYLSAHPGAVAVNIACGLDTRCYRMQGYQHWYNLDLPETIAVREKLLPENGKISQIAMSAMDDWGGMIRESGDALVIIEGLAMYLSEADVQRIFDVIARRFPRVTVLVEVMNPLVVRNFKEKSIEGSHAKFTWGVRDGQALAALLPEKNVMFAFSLSAGHRESSRVVSIDLKKITIGQLRTSPSNKALIDEIFAGTRYKVVYQPNMGDYLLCHAAFVTPAAFACYKTDGNLKKLKGNTAYLRKMVDANIEAYRAIRDAGHEILPDADKAFESDKYRKVCLRFFKLMAATSLGKVCASDHAMSATDEMSALNRDLKQFFDANGADYPVWRALEKECGKYLK